MATYRNLWHTPGAAHYGPEFFSTDKKPLEYRGFQIFNRHAGCYELVKDGVCLTQLAGKGGPAKVVDALASGEEGFIVDRVRALAAKHGVDLTVAESSQ